METNRNSLGSTHRRCDVTRNWPRQSSQLFLLTNNWSIRLHVISSSNLSFQDPYSYTELFSVIRSTRLAPGVTSQTTKLSEKSSLSTLKLKALLWSTGTNFFVWCATAESVKLWRWIDPIDSDERNFHQYPGLFSRGKFSSKNLWFHQSALKWAWWLMDHEDPVAECFISWNLIVILKYFLIMEYWS